MLYLLVLMSLSLAITVPQTTQTLSVRLKRRILELYYLDDFSTELFGNGVKQKMIPNRIYGKQNMVNKIIEYWNDLVQDWSSILWRMVFTM